MVTGVLGSGGFATVYRTWQVAVGRETAVKVDSQVLLASRVSRARRIAARRWSIQVLPPDEAAYDGGVRTYRCLATLGYGRSKSSQFGL